MNYVCTMMKAELPAWFKLFKEREYAKTKMTVLFYGAKIKKKTLSMGRPPVFLSGTQTLNSDFMCNFNGTLCKYKNGLEIKLLKSKRKLTEQELDIKLHLT